MGTTVTIIIGLLYVVIHVGSYLAREAAKRKEQLERRQAAERVRLGIERPAPDSTSRVELEAAPAPSAIERPGLRADPARVSKPLDDLAARRKAQLEQLRNRRDTRRTGQPIQQRGAGAPPADLRSSIRSSGSPRQHATVGQVPEVMRIQRMEQDRREREQAKTRRDREARFTQQREAEAQAVRRRDEVVRARRATATASRQHEPSPQAVASAMPRTSQQSVKAGRIQPRRRLKDPAALREAFVLKELIDPPLALRQPSNSAPI